MFSITGRTPRVELWLFVVYTSAVIRSCLMVRDAHAKGLFPAPDFVVVLVAVLWLALLGLYLAALGAIAARRANDIGLPRVFALIAPLAALAPYGIVLVLVLFGLLPGQKGANRFGSDPREPEDRSAWARTTNDAAPAGAGESA